MPLNIEDNGPIDPGNKPGPLRQQDPPDPPDSTDRKKIYPWLLLILVISSGVFLLFQFGILPPGKKGIVAVPSPGVNTQVAVPDTNVPVRIPPETVAPPPETGEEKYTIVISAFASSVDAEEMAGRWSSAGFEAAIQHAAGWYRVTLGRFRTVSDARQEAERVKQALEQGYWITRRNI